VDPVPGTVEEYDVMKRSEKPMSIHSDAAGRSGMVSHKGTGGSASAKEKREENSLENARRISVQDFGSDHNKKNPVLPNKVKAKTEATVIIHDKKRGGISVKDMYQKTRGIVQRAMELLESWKFQPASIRGSKLPVDIVALRDDMDMLVQVISSKHPILDAKTLFRRYKKKIDALRLMGTSSRFRKILMAHSLPCGWKHYDVLPGGLIPAWDLHKSSQA
jgi:hypothetical protein